MKPQKKILIVEDDQSLRDAIAEVLRSKAFLPIEAVNGKEGVEKALSEHPDLILLDLVMPVMSGMEALTKIREDKWGKNVPVIILTNLDASDDRLTEDVVKGMPIYYLVKSDIKIYDVVDKIEKLIH
ncbi:MAG: response regulator [Candidatus Berkelbacteria bacterium]